MLQNHLLAALQASSGKSVHLEQLPLVICFQQATTLIVPAR
jgi:hypothetical protein